MLLKDLKKEKIYNQHDMLNEGAPCYDENEILDIADVNYMNEQGEGVYSIWLGTRGEYEIDKITDEKDLNSDLYKFRMTEEEFEKSCERGDECFTDYFYYKQL